MWRKRYCSIGGATSFFYLGLIHNSLSNYYQLNFSLMQHHKYSLTELENMMPWEREIYLGLLQKYIKERNEEIEKERQRVSQR